MNLADMGAVALGTAARGGALWLILAAGIAAERRTPRPLLATAAACWSAEATALALAI